MTMKIGMLGVAHAHANAYVGAAEGVEDAAVVAVADDDKARGQEFADRHDIEYGPTADVLDQVDIGVVCAANADHREWVEQAAEAGVDVLCEKPLATTAEDGQAMVEACEETGVTLGVAMPVRFNEPIRHAKAAYEDGELGDLQAIIGTNLLTWMAAGSWITDPEQAGGGAITDHTVHVVDLARWITGQEVTEVYAESGTLFNDELDVEDVDLLSMELEDGTPFTHDGSWCQPDTWDFWGDVTMRLIGTEKVIEVDCFDRTLKQTTAEDGIWQVDWGENMNEGMVRDFVEAVREGREPEVSGAEGLKEVKVVEAAYESVESGGPVEISYD